MKTEKDYQKKWEAKEKERLALAKQWEAEKKKMAKTREMQLKDIAKLTKKKAITKEINYEKVLAERHNKLVKIMEEKNKEHKRIQADFKAQWKLVDQQRKMEKRDTALINNKNFEKKQKNHTNELVMKANAKYAKKGKAIKVKMGK